MNITKPTIAAAALFLTFPISAQSETRPTKSSPFRMAIHTADADAGIGYGTWASEDNYKVSFHDGMSFYPILGAAYPENLPLTWRTSSVSFGGEAIVLSDRVASHSDWRFEYRSAGMTEAYDVRVDGVEQTFVFSERPAHAGDLVITGSLTTELRGDRQSAHHGALTFRDTAGKPILKYGAATVIDASGESLPITTSLEGNTIQLRVPGAWLLSATYPVVVDPLLSTVMLTGAFGGVTSAPKIARDDAVNEMVSVYVRLASANDKDLYSMAIADDLSMKTVIFGDITASWSTATGDVAFVQGSRKWLFAIERDFRSLSYKALRYKLHNSGSHTVNNTVHSLAGGAGKQTTKPQVGGSTSGSTGLIVYQIDRTNNFGGNTSRSEIWAINIDTSRNTRINAVQISKASTTLDSERPCIVEQRLGTRPWMITYQQLNNTIPGDDWDCYITRTDHVLTPHSSYIFGDIKSSVHCVHPQVGGRNGDLLVVMGRIANSNRYTLIHAPELIMQTLSWPPSQTAPSRGPIKVLRTSGSLIAGGIAYDSVTLSHYSIASFDYSGNKVHVDRVGYDASIAESLEIGIANRPTLPAITYDDDHHDYTILWATGQQINARKFVYPTLAAPQLYGRACMNGKIRPALASHAGKPFAGNERFAIDLSNAKLNENAILMMSLGGSGIDLGFLGMTGCDLSVNPNLMLTTVPVVTSSIGFARVLLPLPAPLDGTVYFQWAAFGANNVLGLGTTQGLRIEIK